MLCTCGTCFYSAFLLGLSRALLSSEEEHNLTPVLGLVSTCSVKQQVVSEDSHFLLLSEKVYQILNTKVKAILI